MSITCKVRIVLDNISPKKAKAVTEALAPDNVDFPENLTLKVEKFDNKLVFDFSGQDNMKKLVATIDEVLEHVQVVLRVIE